MDDRPCRKQEHECQSRINGIIAVGDNTDWAYGQIESSKTAPSAMRFQKRGTACSRCGGFVRSLVSDWSASVVFAISTLSNYDDNSFLLAMGSIRKDP